jgi:hypothetical protein
VAAAPVELAHGYDVFWANPAVLDAAASFQPDAAFVTYTATNVGDRYGVFDCSGVTTGANVNPCVNNITLAAALNAGLVSNSDGRTYHHADGVTATVSGVPVWVAHTARRQSATLSATVQYRIYFELNGNVYTGALIKDGAVLGGGYWVSNPGGTTALERYTFLTYQVRLNKAAHDSLAAAMKI